MLIPAQAGEGQVLRNSLTAMLLGDDVINLERNTLMDEGHLAVFAQPVRPLPDLLFERRVFGAAG